MLGKSPLQTGALVAVVMMAGIGIAGPLAGNKATAAESGTVSSNIHDYVASHLDDFTAVMHVTQHDDNEGRKISKDFNYLYKLRGDVKVSYKEENKLRFDGRIGATNATYIVNGTKQYARVPAFNIKTTINLDATPGKRKTLLDVGLISAGYLEYTRAEFMGAHPVDGTMCAKFKVTYLDKSDTSHRILWIDPRSKLILKHEEYSQEDKLNATFYYKQPSQVAPGIFFPGKILVVNNEDKKAGEMVYRDVKVNQGLDDGLFRL